MPGIVKCVNCGKDTAVGDLYYLTEPPHRLPVICEDCDVLILSNDEEFHGPVSESRGRCEGSAQLPLAALLEAFLPTLFDEGEYGLYYYNSCWHLTGKMKRILRTFHCDTIPAVAKLAAEMRIDVDAVARNAWAHEDIDDVRYSLPSDAGDYIV